MGDDDGEEDGGALIVEGLMCFFAYLRKSITPRRCEIRIDLQEPGFGVYDLIYDEDGTRL